MFWMDLASVFREVKAFAAASHFLEDALNFVCNTDGGTCTQGERLMPYRHPRLLWACALHLRRLNNEIRAIPGNGRRRGML